MSKAAIHGNAYGIEVYFSCIIIQVVCLEEKKGGRGAAIFSLKRLNLNQTGVSKQFALHPLTHQPQTQLKCFLVRKHFKSSEQGQFKPDVSPFLPTPPAPVATLAFSSASVPGG